LGLTYELHLARATQDLKLWSLQFSFDTGASHYDLGGVNGLSQEKMYGAGINYYLLNNPLSLNKIMVEIGVGIKSGESNMKGSYLNSAYSYQILCVPSLQLMTKYRYRVGDLNEDTVKLGSSLFAGIVYDQKKLSLLDTPLDSINGTINVNDLKFQFGIGFYF
jgi:hypothetical protein